MDSTVSPGAVAPVARLGAASGPILLVPMVDSVRAHRLPLGSALSVLFVALEEGRPVVGPSSDARSPLAGVLPGDVVGAVAFSEAGEAVLQVALALWRDGGHPPLPVHVFGQDAGSSPLRFSQWLQDCLLDQRREMATLAAGLMRQLAQVRTVHEQLQDSFRTVEDFLATLQVPRMAIAACLDPTATGAQLVGVDAAMASAGWLRQRLPCSSRAVAMVDLHVKALAPAAAPPGTLSVTLLEAGSGSVVKEWRVQTADLSAGWLSLTLGGGIAGLPRDLELAAVWIGSGTGPTLSLGRPTPFPSRCAQVQAGPLVDRPLSLRVWTALPGLGAIPPRAVAAGGDAGRARRRALPIGAIEAGEAIGPQPDDPDWRMVHKLSHGKGLRIHPLEGYMAVAAFRQACPPGTRKVDVLVLTDHADADPIDYAVVAGASDEVVLACLRPGAPELEAPAFSGWIRVPPRVPTVLTVLFTRPSPLPTHLHVATRVSDGFSSRYGWASVVSVTFELMDEA